MESERLVNVTLKVKSKDENDAVRKVFDELRGGAGVSELTVTCGQAAQSFNTVHSWVR